MTSRTQVVEVFRLDTTVLEDRGTTGNFEVTVDGQLIHSKRHAGQGRAETDKEKAAIVRNIQAILDGEQPE